LHRLHLVAALLLVLLLAGCQAAGPTAPAPPAPGAPAAVPGAQPTPDAAAARLPRPAADVAMPEHLIVSSVAFWDEQHGLLAGTAECPGTCQPMLARTADGGKSWRLLARGGASVRTLSVTGSADVWADAGDCSNGCRGWLLASHDGGATWAEVAGDGAEPSFVAGGTGWALGLTGANLRATHDGGHTWTALEQPCTGQPYDARALSFPTAAKGWLLCSGQPGAGSQAKAVYATTDGGKSWTTAVEVPFTGGVVNGLPRGGYAGGIFFRPDGHGWLWMARGGFFASADGGRNWEGLLLARPESAEVRSAWFLSDTLGWVVRQNMEQGRWELLQTRDGGQSGTLLQSWALPK